MQLAAQKLLGSHSTLSLLSVLLVTPAGLDKLQLDRKCLRYAGRHARSQERKASSAKFPAEIDFATRRRPGRRAHFVKPLSSRPTAPQRRQHGSSLNFQRHINTKPVLQDHTNPLHGKRTDPSSSRLSNYLNECAAFRSADWALDPEKLKFESDVGHSRDIGSKLIDDPHFSNDFELWKLLLLYRKRHDGDDGVIDIWRGLRERGEPVDLPVEGDSASFLWKNFITVGWKRNYFLSEIHSYATELYERSGKVWDREKYYESVVVGLFKKGLFAKGVEWHKRLKDTHLSNPNAILLQLFESAASIDGGLRAFRKICRTFDNHQVYSAIMPQLSGAGRMSDALAMHDFLLQRNDLPRTVQDVKPLIQYLRCYGTKAENQSFLANLTMKGLLQDGKFLELFERRPHGATGKDTASRVDGEGNYVSDNFGARFFATKTFTFELFVAGVKAFGATSIGQQTLRQMALKAGNAKKLSEQLDILEREGISIGDTAFSRVVRKLASDGDDFVLNELLQSDLHPEVFENLKTQEDLFAAYSIADDQRRARMVYKILTILSTEDIYDHNILLRKAVNVKDWRRIPLILDKMREHSIPPSQESLDLMIKKILPVRRLGMQEARDPENLRAITYMIGILQNLVSVGVDVSAHRWNEILKRFGMRADWNDLRKLCLWLIHFYSPMDPKQEESPLTDPNFPERSIHKFDQKRLLLPAHPDSPLRQIFSVHLQTAIVAWGFSLAPNSKEIYYNTFSKEREKIIPWVRGHVLLRELKEQGVIVQMNTVRLATRLRLAVLFGDYRLSNRPRNRLLRAVNPWTLEEILRDIDRVWGVSVFGKMVEDPHRLVNPPQRSLNRSELDDKQDQAWKYHGHVSQQMKYREEKRKVEKQLYDRIHNYND
ncbi:hypothetical protein PAAG_08270 [Paracoccidioides lutzii Pb01]|uniref:Pentatricopeptide repeat protein n=1 Tax=Paracoccidioides lutzii (strain ATCC MYA-826 / Pb01) TaxID=502779 RepID=C1HBX9_PARBA|nr:hypothetical protein PAAG_08270 [Paracoccidioides lutzii Pb01]EEH38543.2 hypothetical protein PAAG_08270 [Paracoccidioides lutzii Pb01]